MKISWSEWWDTYRYNKSGAKYVVKNGLVAKAKFRICPEKVPDEDGNWVIQTDWFIIPVKPIEYVTFEYKGKQ